MRRASAKGAADAVLASDGLVRIAASAGGDADAAARGVLAAIGPDTLAGAVVFCANRDLLEAAARQAAATAAGLPIVGCTTAGEITPWGAGEGGITAIGFPAADFFMQALRFDGLMGFDPFAAHRLVAELVAEVTAKAAHLAPSPDLAGLLLIDGLSCREELLTHTMRHLLEEIPMVGGSAGDGMRFRETHLLHGGTIGGDRAVLVLLASRRPLRVFRSSHHAAGEMRAVITRADTAARKVLELNGEPAAAEYARLTGVETLSDRTFAAHPMMVRAGGDYHARAVMRADGDGALAFHSAIERGLVLRIGHSTGMLDRLAAALDRCGEGAAGLDAVIVFDSVQNRIEAEAAGLSDDLLAIYRRDRFVGFHTYGEQYRDLHLNRNVLGLAIGKRLLC